RGVDDAPAPADPDIVVEQIESAKARERGVDKSAALRFVDDVGDMRGGGAAFGHDHRYGLLRRLGHDVDDENARALPRQEDRRRRARSAQRHDRLWRDAGADGAALRHADAGPAVESDGGAGHHPEARRRHLYGGGLAIGVVMLFLSLTGLIDRLAAAIPK